MLRTEALRVLGLCDTLEAKVGLSPISRWRIRKARFFAKRSFVSQEFLAKQRQLLVSAVLNEQASRSPSVLAFVGAGAMAVIAPLEGLLGILTWLGVGPSGIGDLFTDADTRAALVALALMTSGTALAVGRSLFSFDLDPPIDSVSRNMSPTPLNSTELD
jgi:hypothetical protein